MSPIVLCDKETGRIKTFKTKSILEIASLMTKQRKIILSCCYEDGKWFMEVEMSKIKGKMIELANKHGGKV